MEELINRLFRLIRSNVKCWTCEKRLWFTHVYRGPQFCNNQCEKEYYDSLPVD